MADSAKRTQSAIPGSTLWNQLMIEFDPEDRDIVDKNTYDCLRKYDLAV